MTVGARFEGCSRTTLRGSCDALSRPSLRCAALWQSPNGKRPKLVAISVVPRTRLRFPSSQRARSVPLRNCRTVCARAAERTAVGATSRPTPPSASVAGFGFDLDLDLGYVVGPIVVRAVDVS